mgnify:CR=1 FL=1
MSAPYSNFPAVEAALAALEANRTPEANTLRNAVRALLTALAKAVPGRTVEVRVPPYGAVQCVAGPRHTRGTPPNVVEMDPVTWILLATGRLSWSTGVESGRIRASGHRSDISRFLPVR